MFGCTATTIVNTIVQLIITQLMINKLSFQQQLTTLVNMAIVTLSPPQKGIRLVFSRRHVHQRSLEAFFVGLGNMEPVVAGWLERPGSSVSFNSDPSL